MSSSIEKTSQDYYNINPETPRLHELERQQKIDNLSLLGMVLSILGVTAIMLGAAGLAGGSSFYNNKVISGILIGLGSAGSLAGAFFMSRIYRG